MIRLVQAGQVQPTISWPIASNLLISRAKANDQRATIKTISSEEIFCCRLDKNADRKSKSTAGCWNLHWAFVVKDAPVTHGLLCEL